MNTKAQAILTLKPEIEFKFEGQKFTALNGWVLPSEAEIQAKIAELQAAEPLRLLRQQRNQLLQQTDWMANSDVTMSEEWRVYRQALRDLPNTQTPSLDENGQLTNITWPEKPQ